MEDLWSRRVETHKHCDQQGEAEPVLSGAQRSRMGSLGPCQKQVGEPLGLPFQRGFPNCHPERGASACERKSKDLCVCFFGI